MSNSVYYNARTKALEANLISYPKLTTLVKCSSIAEVSKLLNDWKILKGINILDYSDLILVVQREEEEFIQLLKQATPDKSISKFFLLKYDYFNLQVLYLNKHFNSNLETTFDGSILVSTLKHAVESGNYKGLSPQMQKCLEFVDSLFKNGTKTGFLIDTAFKKSLYEEMLFVSRKNKELYKYINFLIDMSNIEFALRFRDFNLFSKIKLLGGTLDDKFLNNLCTMSFDQILVYAKQSIYFSAIDLIVSDLKQGVALDRFELMVDCFGQTYFDKFKYETAGQTPYIRYCFLKQSELLNFRIIFEGLKANRPKKKILNELRRVYAE